MLVTNFDKKSHFIENPILSRETSKLRWKSHFLAFLSSLPQKHPKYHFWSSFVVSFRWNLVFKISDFWFQIFRFPISLVLLYGFPWKSSCALFFTSSTRSASLIEIWVTFMIISKFENYNFQSHIKCWLNKILHNRFRYKMISE